MPTDVPIDQESSLLRDGGILHKLFISKVGADRTFEPVEMCRELFNESRIRVLNYCILRYHRRLLSVYFVSVGWTYVDSRKIASHTDTDWR